MSKKKDYRSNNIYFYRSGLEDKLERMDVNLAAKAIKKSKKPPYILFDTKSDGITTIQNTLQAEKMAHDVTEHLVSTI